MATGLLQNRDIEYDELERNDPLSGEPRYAEDEGRNATFAMIFGGLAGVFCLVAMILTWVLYFRERTRTFLWHAIWLIFAMLFGFACAAWGSGANTDIRLGRQPSAMFTMVIFLGSLIFFVYMVAESLWLIFYRPIHFGYLVGLRGNNDLWNSRMYSGSSFSEGWTSSRRMMWWVTFFTLISGLCFAFIAYATRSVVWNRYQLTRIGLYAACLFMALAGFLVIYWAEECFEYESLQSYGFDKDITRVLKVLGIIAVILAFVAAVVNLIKNKLGYFIMGILFVVLLVLLICTGGSLWRAIRINQDKTRSGKCQANLFSIHEDNLKNICINGGKYLSAGESCTKEYLVNRWEGGSTNDLRMLNPSCCYLGGSFYYYPFMLLAYWTLILTLCTAVALFFCFYLADTSEYLTNGNRPSNIIDYIGLALIVLLCLAWILYFIFRKANSIPNGGANYTQSYQSPNNIKVDKFDLVPRSVVAGANPPVNNNGCFNYSAPSMINPATNPTDATCSSNCVERVAILAKNSEINLPNTYSGANPGSQSSRAVFFPGCTASSNGYAMIYGTNAQIQDALKNIVICRKDFNNPPNLLVYHDQVPANQINSQGLQNNETSVTASNTNTNSASCGNGFDSSSTTCSGFCKKAFTVPNSNLFATLKGSLFYIDQGQTKTDIHSNVQIAATANGNAIGNSVNLFNGGIFTIANIPVLRDSDYTIRIAITDPVKKFLSKQVDVLIEANNGGRSELSVGKIRLLSSSGAFCAVSDTNCLNNQNFTRGNMILSVKDATNENNVVMLPSAGISASQDFITGGPQMGAATTDGTGTTRISSLPYGSYTVVASKAGYLPSSSRVDLQEPTYSVSPILLRPQNDDIDMRIVASMNEPSADFDLKLNMQSDKGGFCQTSPYNKYCPYTAHLTDVAFGVGDEVVGVKRMTVSNYLAFVAPSPPYSATCSAATAASEAAGHYQGNWNWDSFKNSKALEFLNIFVRSYGSSANSNNDKGADSITTQPPVETTAQSLIQKLLIAVNGKAIPANLQKNVSTDVRMNPTSFTPSDGRNIRTNNTATADGITVTTVTYDQVLDSTTVDGKVITNSGVYTNGTKISEVLTQKTLTGSSGDNGTAAEINQSLDFKNGSAYSLVKSNSSMNKTSGDWNTYNTETETKKAYPENKQETQRVTTNITSTAFPVTLTNESRGESSTLLTNGSTKTESGEFNTYSSPDQTSQKAFVKSVVQVPNADTWTTIKDVSEFDGLTGNKNKRSFTSETAIGELKNGSVFNTTSIAEIINATNNPNITQQTEVTSQTNPDKSYSERRKYTKVTDAANNPHNGERLEELTINNIGAPGSSNFTRSESTTTTLLANASTVTLTSVNTKTVNPDGTSQSTMNLTNTVAPNDNPKATYSDATNSSKAFLSNKTAVIHSSRLSRTAGTNGANDTWARNESVIVAYPNGTQVTYTTLTLGTVDSDELESTTVQTTTTVGTVPTTRRRLSASPAHMQGSAANFILVNCFTGFGRASVIELYSYQSTEPTFDQCLPTLAANKPQLTLPKLRAAAGN